MTGNSLIVGSSSASVAGSRVIGVWLRGEVPLARDAALFRDSGGAESKRLKSAPLPSPCSKKSWKGISGSSKYADVRLLRRPVRSVVGLRIEVSKTVGRDVRGSTPNISEAVCGSGTCADQ